MTDKLKCPFCGAELERCSYLSKGITNPVFVCRNGKCKFVNKIIDSDIWQALIDGKRAQDALKVAINALKYVEKHEEDDYPNDVHYRIDLALRRITSITKRENE